MKVIPVTYKKVVETKHLMYDKCSAIDQHIDRIVYISSKTKHPDRYEYIKNIISDIKIKPQHFEAIYPTLSEIISGKYKHLKDRFTDRLLEYQQSDPNRLCGIIGCYLSHYMIHVQASKESWGNYLILEDDVFWELDAGVPKWFKYVFSWLSNKIIPRNWDIFRCLSDNLHPSDGIYTLDTPNSQSRWKPDHVTGENTNNISRGSHFQLCKGTSTNKIVEYFESENVYNVDSIYSTDQLNVYFAGIEVKNQPPNNELKSTIPKQ